MMMPVPRGTGAEKKPSGLSLPTMMNISDRKLNLVPNQQGLGRSARAWMKPREFP
ncbi:hypothetical protein [Crocosphaera sp.]|uniref:hypothetical protein n=1 Tax=Crocosphaera sp. TaxID=2729996 RepID=UPI0026270462|nr:hypothetical protein [Crocosphaera sp.]MDJ0582963.1 hypothetical protein [Crocosphaera sp.]